MISDNVYIAASFERYAEIDQIAKQIESYGDRVVSTWHSSAHTDTSANFDTNQDMWGTWAEQDLRELRKADIFLTFTGGSGRGGRHVEFGYALGLDLPIIVVGPREHVFHMLEHVVYFETWDDLVAERESAINGISEV